MAIWLRVGPLQIRDDIFTFDTRITEKTEAYYVKENSSQCEISGFSCSAFEAFVGSVGNCVPTTQVRIMIPSFKGQAAAWPLKTGPIACPVTSQPYYQLTPSNTPEQRKPYVESLLSRYCVW
jgi:hypothetical protein